MWLLAAILVVAAGLRIYGLAFGLPALYDPDEPIFVLTAIKLLRDQTLNPAWFGHPGTTTIYALAVVDLLVFGWSIATGQVADAKEFSSAIYGNSTLIFLPNRVFIMLCGVLCVFLTYQLGRRLFDVRVGLVAAALLAIDPVHIKYSQVIRTDVHATVLMLLCLLTTVRIVERGERRDYLLAGCCLGLCCATKWPFGTAVIAIVGASVLRMLRHPEEQRRQLRRLMLAGVASLIALFVASPYLLLDYRVVLEDLRLEGRPYHLGATGHGFWRNVLWYLQNSLYAAVGGAGLAFAGAGVVPAARRSGTFRFTLVPLAATLLVLISSQALIWERWIVPLLPLVSIAAAVAMVELWSIVRQRSGSRATAWLAGAIAGMAVAGPLLVDVRASAAERINDTRRLSTAWIRANVPPGKTILVEYLALDLLGHGWRFLYPVGDGGCVDVASNVKAKIRFSTIERWRAGRPIVDIGTLNPATIPSCRADYAVLVDYDRYRAEPTRYGNEIANYDRIIAAGTIIQTFRPEPGRTGGWVVRIVAMQKTPT